jgi:hypothetical protein
VLTRSLTGLSHTDSLPIGIAFDYFLAAIWKDFEMTTTCQVVTFELSKRA